MVMTASFANTGAAGCWCVMADTESVKSTSEEMAKKCDKLGYLLKQISAVGVCPKPPRSNHFLLALCLVCMLVSNLSARLMRYLILMLLFLSGCSKGYDDAAKQLQAHADALYDQALASGLKGNAFIAHMRTLPEYAEAMHLVDSLLIGEPNMRFWNASHAHKDSIGWARLHLTRVQDLYYFGDTTAAVFAYLDVLPWLTAFAPGPQADNIRRLAETIADAVDLTHSPNMARLSYQVFERAKRLALDYGDLQYIHLADSSYRVVARQVMTMPDSVRAAFGPAPERPARVPWALATFAAAFFAASIAGGWGWNNNYRPL